MNACTHTNKGTNSIIVYDEYNTISGLKNTCPMCEAEERIKELQQRVLDLEDTLDSMEG